MTIGEVDDEAFDAAAGEQSPLTFAELGLVSEEELESYIQEGIDSYERDGGVPHHVAMAEIDQLLADLAARRTAAK